MFAVKQQATYTTKFPLRHQACIFGNITRLAPDGPVVEVLLQEQNARGEVAIVVLVRNTPPKGSKFPSLLNLVLE